MANFASHLWLYSGVPLDNTYEHTYASVDKLSYKKWAKPPAPMYYIRPDKNTIRIKHDGNMTVANLPLYECNYLKFSNNSYEGIDFYCFVTEVRYINDETAEIDFEIDVMMTWVASGLVTFEQCFVERETTNSDDIGEHILEEPVDVGDYIYREITHTDFRMLMIVGVKGYNKGTASNPDWTDDYSTISYSDGDFDVYDGISRHRFYADNGTTAGSEFASIDDLFTSLRNAGKKDWVLFVYYTPYVGTGYTGHDASRLEYMGNNFAYQPKNKKLLTYPYIGCMINNYEGNTNEYAFELGNNGTINFGVSATITDGACSIFPTNYEKGTKNCMLVKSKYPIASASASEYSTYKAQMFAQMPAELISNIAVPAVTGALIGGGVVGGAVGAGAGLVSYVVKAFSGGEQAKLKGATPTNNNSGMLPATNGTLQFGIYRFSIRTEYARAIDDFFTKFGYKVNRLKIPSKYNSRLSWKYIKTIGCAIEGEAPASAVSKIQNIMDNGITFWDKPEIGQYTFPS